MSVIAKLPEAGLDCRLPAADHHFDPVVERCNLWHAPPLAQVKRIADERDFPITQFDRPAQLPGIGRFGQHVRNCHATGRGQFVAR